MTPAEIEAWLAAARRRTCPACKTGSAYIGFNGIECINNHCRHYSAALENDWLDKVEAKWAAEDAAAPAGAPMTWERWTEIVKEAARAAAAAGRDYVMAPPLPIVFIPRKKVIIADFSDPGAPT